MKAQIRLAAMLLSAAHACAMPHAAAQTGPAVDTDLVKGDGIGAVPLKDLAVGDYAKARDSARQALEITATLDGKASGTYRLALEVSALVAFYGDYLVAPAGKGTTDNYAARRRAQLLQEAGRLDDAMAEYRAIEQQARASVSEKAATAMAFGDLLVLDHDDTNAAGQFAKAAQMYRSQGNSGKLGLLEAQARTAAILGRSGEKARSDHLFDEVAAEIRQLCAPFTTFCGYGFDDISEQFERSGKAAQAEAWRRGAHAVYAATLDYDLAATMGGHLVWNLLAQPGKERQALARARSSTGLLDAPGTVAVRSTYETELADVRRWSMRRLFVDLANADFAAGQARLEDPAALKGEAFLALQAATLNQASNAALLAAATKAVPDLTRRHQAMVDEWDGLQSRIGAAFATGDDGRADLLVYQQQDLDRQIKSIDRQIETIAPRYWETLIPHAMPIAEAQAMLHDNEAAMLIVPGAGATMVMVVTKGEIGWHRAAISATDMAIAVHRLRRSLDPRLRPADPATGWAFDRQTAHALYRALITPELALLRGKTHVFLIQDGALSALPLHVLVTDTPVGDDADPAALRATHWLGDAFALVQLPSLQALKVLRAASPSPPNRDPARVAMVGFGDPVLGGPAAIRGSRDDVRGIDLDMLLSGGQAPAITGLASRARLERLARLPGTGTELTTLNTIFGGSRLHLYLGPAATEDQVKHSDLSNVDVLVFATHALTGGAVGVHDAGLVLTPPPTATSDDDGLLTETEIVGLKLGVDWVVLSACDTAGGQDGAVVSGIARAFLAGGAKTLLVSHWPVFDAVAGELTTNVFLALKSDPGLSRAQALQRAGQQVRNMPGHPEFAHPAYWAPFSLVGDGAGH